MLRLWGDQRDEGTARLAFLISFPALLICPVLLTLDLGKPVRFWHMLIDSRTGLPVFKYWSPMSVGVWVLTIFGIFGAVSFVEALVLERRLRHPVVNWLESFLRSARGRAFMIVGSVLGLFIAGYTGVLLSVSNQPVWSDTWALGGLFLASGLSAAAATIGLAAWSRRDTKVTMEKVSEADRYFILLELLLLVAFFVTLGSVVSKVLTGGWLLLWLVVLVGIAVPLAVHFRTAWARGVSPILASSIALVGVLALRAVVIFSAQS